MKSNSIFYIYLMQILDFYGSALKASDESEISRTSVFLTHWNCNSRFATFFRALVKTLCHRNACRASIIAWQVQILILIIRTLILKTHLAFLWQHRYHIMFCFYFNNRSTVKRNYEYPRRPLSNFIKSYVDSTFSES